MVEIEFRQLEYFVAVAEELHFGRAAMRVHVTQPALSEQIRLMEERLDVQLFVRTTRTVRLTPAGRLLLKHVRSILAQTNSAIGLARAEARKKLPPGRSNAS